MNEFHDFLLKKDGGLSEPAKKLPDIRRYIDGMPETKATFLLSQVPGVEPSGLRRVHCEFVGSWQLHRRYKDREYAPARFVNPRYVHREKFMDMIVTCECGAVFSEISGVGMNGLGDESEHREDCLPQYRMEARSRLYEEVYERILRLTRIGWWGPDLAPRIACSPASVRDRCRSFDLRLRDLRDEFRRIAGNTYIFLVQENGVSSRKLADVYDHTPSSLREWAREYAEYESGEECEVDSDADRYLWRKAKDQRNPQWLKEQVEG